MARKLDYIYENDLELLYKIIGEEEIKENQLILEEEHAE